MENYAYLGFLATVVTTVWSLAWWLNGHFNGMRKELAQLGKDILNKLEYHERHDDSRFSQVDSKFSQVRDDIWDIRVRNAAADGILKPTRSDRDLN